LAGLYQNFPYNNGTWVGSLFLLQLLFTSSNMLFSTFLNVWWSYFCSPPYQQSQH